jgi:sterol desaturase/sphingolipid hydroxylase (fatty acid hydroxylase superfamily)
VPGWAPKRLFDAALSKLSKMSTTPLNYWAGFGVDVPLGAALLYLGLRRNELTSFDVLATVLLGLFLFSLIEYSFHRWLLHGSVRFLAEGHRAHHERPQGHDSLPFFVPGLILLTLTGLLVCLMPPSIACLLIGTIAMGYATYGLSHFVLHHHRFPQGLARSWAAIHHVHHFRIDTNFGVTTPLWDMVMGTRYVAHPESGNVRERP